MGTQALSQAPPICPLTLFLVKGMVYRNVGSLLLPAWTSGRSVSAPVQ
jgi:hypothetical protein